MTGSNLKPFINFRFKLGKYFILRSVENLEPDSIYHCLARP
jgi:hypothetical protein